VEIVAMLDHTLGDLLILCVTFLKKIAIFEENKDILKEMNIVGKLGEERLFSMNE
jgi:Kinesin-associated protein (KAP)